MSAGDPFIQAKEDIEPNMMDFYRGSNETVEVASDPTWLPTNDTRARWKGKGTLEYTAPSAATAQFGSTVGDTNIGGTDFCLIASVRYKSFNRWSRVIDWSNGANNNNIIFGNNNTSDNGRIQANNTDRGTQNYEKGDYLKPADNSWMTIIATIEHTGKSAGNGNTRFALWYDGVEVGGSNKNHATLNALPRKLTRSINYIGRSPWGGDWEFNGFMDEIGVMHEIPDEQQIAEISRVGKVRKKD